MREIAIEESLNEFQHQPLDHGVQSIRVIQILPDLTTDGMIQCHITHTTTQADYSCLSYVWGPRFPGKVIVVNGKSFWVRQNLFDFLEQIRSMAKPTNRTWVDALCIDQANVSERNHQVQQMGDIYAKARCVYIWLGLLPSLSSVGHLLSPSWWRNILSLDREYYRRRISRLDVFENEYWTRAWITQELLLARQLRVILRETVLDFDDFLVAIGYPRDELGGVNIKGGGTDETRKLTRTMQPMIRFKTMQDGLNDVPLVVLLESLCEMQCSTPRDRIFSLLSLCAEGNTIRVDYSRSDHDLAYAILRQCQHSLCICSIRLLGHVLSFEGWVSAAVHPVGPFIEMDIRRGLIADKTTAKKTYWQLLTPEFLEPTEFIHGIELDMKSWFAGPSGLCETLYSLLHQLRVLAALTPDTVPQEPKTQNCFVGEEILSSGGIYELFADVNLKPEEPLARVRLFANGFSFGSAEAPGYDMKLRISLGCVWNLSRGMQHSLELCNRARRRLALGPSPFVRLGYGPWNLNAEREASSMR